ncbi:MAG: hypothetical protein SF053_08465 [Bacteroidia bacterium]|nr:hypothetical protein [Bacteroidia bacterium]
MAKNRLYTIPSQHEGNLFGYQLPKGLVEITIKRTGTQYDLLTPSVEWVPDPRFSFALKYESGWFTSDEISIDFTEEGFLKRVYTVIDDQLDEVIGKAVKAGVEIAGMAIPLPTGVRGVEEILFTGKIDPFDAGQITRLNTYLQQIDPSLKMETPCMCEPKAISQPDAGQVNAGILCRPLGTCQLSLSTATGPVTRFVRIPNPEALFLLNVPFAPLVRTTLDVTFNKGIPVSLKVNRPSAANAVADTVLGAISAILELPSKLFQFRINLSNRYTDAAAAQQANQQRMAALAASVASLENTLQYQEQTRASVTSGGSTTRPTPGSGGSTANPGAGAGNAQTGNLAELTNAIQKLRQDVDVIRKRMNADGEKE